MPSLKVPFVCLMNSISSDFEDSIEELEMRNGGLSHPDRADRFRFDHRMTRRRPTPSRAGGGHPACRTAADDDDVAYVPVGHHGIVAAATADTPAAVAVFLDLAPSIIF